MKPANHDLSMARAFLACLDRDGVFTFQTFDDNAQRKDQRLNAVRHGTFDEHVESLVSLNRNGAGVFVMVNRGDGKPHPGKNTCRCNENVIAVRALFADADGVPVEPILKKAPPPHILVESSQGKWHLYWLTNDTSLDEFSARQSAIATALGTDPAVKDRARVMRLPGFYHQKGEPFMTRLVLPE